MKFKCLTCNNYYHIKGQPRLDSCPRCNPKGPREKPKHVKRTANNR